MRITGHASPIQNMLLAALPKAADFTAVESPLQSPPPPPAVAGQPVSVEMLVALATSESPLDRRRRVAARAEQALSALERLNADLQAGIPAVEQLRDIAALAPTVLEQADPALAALLQDIELRMRVELAKHDIIA